MSFDREIDQICPHLVVDETLYVDQTNQIIRPIKPIAGLGAINLRLNGLIDIPSPGVQIPVQVLGSGLAPFNITTANNKLVVKVDQGPPQTVVVPSANQMPADKLAGYLNFGLVGVSFTAINGSQLQMQSATTGYAATIWVDGTSTIAGTIGLSTNHLYRGVNVFPGWSLVLDPQSLPALPYRMIIFDVPLKSVGDFVELSYSTVQDQCRRCGGTGVEDDWRYGYNGNTSEVRDEALLIQEIQKIMFTVLGTNPFHTWYGTRLTETIGKRLTVGNFVQNLIISDITTAFNRWQSIKTQQEQTVGQFVSDEEFPYRLLSVDLEQSTQDPTVVYVNVTIQNRSRKPIQISRGLTLPEPLDLLGSTQQQGLIRQSLTHPVLVG